MMMNFLAVSRTDFQGAELFFIGLIVDMFDVPYTVLIKCSVLTCCMMFAALFLDSKVWFCENIV